MKPSAKLYGLDHALLNVELPPKTMWMNMGYWESTSEFPKACQALLDQVLAAGLQKEKSQSVRLLDVGCGCGDQSLYLTSLRKSAYATINSSSTSSFQNISTSYSADSIPRSRIQESDESSLLIDTYIGITLEPAQASLAQQRVESSQVALKSTSKGPVPRIFCANASDPKSWSENLQDSISVLAKSSQDPDTSNWLLALDTLYHFRPSRLPILHYTCNTLHASFMAFDLILQDDVHWFQRLLLRLFCWVSSAPFGNMIPKDQYMQLLMDAGYDSSRIEITDISSHVFAGLSNFLDRRVKEAEPFGFKMGKYRAARKVFGWWAKSGIVRGVVVVARS
ncbi:hypothetical protein N7495_000580 [Penicillium taxi]|uniref:uncharacterized protein n=1 Tax=Penicillium taxi TaxID=168475 RepID=UPI00254513A4|nr:uncharacterized protein N7495_000580 [Penicillium taxi]KAJ5907898.1 hypothetical protein N7495_000580 [Penicillium taxi]